MPSLAILKGFNFSASLSAHIFSIKKDYNCHAPGSQCSFNLHFPKDWVVLRIFGETSIPYLCLFLIFCSCSCWVARPWLLNLIWVWKPPLKWQPTPVFLLGESHGHSSLVGYSPRGRRVGHDWMPEHGGDDTDLSVGNVRLLPYCCCSALASREESILIHTVSHKYKLFVLWDLKWY